MSQSNTGQSNTDKVQAMFDALALGDLDTLTSYLHPEVIVTEADSLPYAGVFRGPEGYVNLIHQVLGAWDDLNIDTRHLLGSGEVVMAVSEFSGKSKAGVEFSMPMTELFYFAEGKVKEVRPFYFDTGKLAALYAGHNQ